MKTVVHSGKVRDNLLHVEAEGCIVNIHIGLTDSDGHAITRVDILPDKYSGESWSLPEFPQMTSFGIRIRKDQKD